MARALDVHKRESMALEKDTTFYLDMNVRSVGKGFYFYFRKGIPPSAPRHYLENIKMVASH